MLYPGKVAMNKVNWKAKLEYEFIQNLKLLQNSFISLKIGRMIEIEKLSKAKYQDNLEFIQWFKRFFEMRSITRNELYDPIARRGSTLADFGFAEKEKNIVAKSKVQIPSKINKIPVKMKENISLESNSNKKTGKKLLEEIQKVLMDNEKKEMDKLAEIYMIMGVKTQTPIKQNSNTMNYAIEEELN